MSPKFIKNWIRRHKQQRYWQQRTKEAQKLADGIAPRVLDLEVSFRDQVYAYQALNLMGVGVAVRAFAMHELIAEKMRPAAAANQKAISPPRRLRHRLSD